MSRPKKFSITKEKLYDLYITQNLSANKIAKMFDVCIATINNTLREYGIKKVVEESVITVEVNKILETKKFDKIVDRRESLELSRVITSKLAPEYCISPKEHLLESEVNQLKDEFYKSLINIFGEGEIYCSYASEELYPYSCDFFIYPLQMCVDFNLGWKHGGRPYAGNATELSQLLEWKKAAKNSQQYMEAISIWTDFDVKKMSHIYRQHIGYCAVYSETQMKEFLKQIKLYVEKESR